MTNSQAAANIQRHRQNINNYTKLLNRQSNLGKNAEVLKYKDEIAKLEEAVIYCLKFI